MKHFKQLAAGVDVNGLALAIFRQPDLWNQNTLRTAHTGSAHDEADDIWLRFVELKERTTAEYLIDDNEAIPYPAWDKLPQARGLIFDLMRRVEGTRLGKVVITKLEPGAEIHPHTDDGKAAEYYQRYHIAIQSLPGAVFRIGDEQVNFATGDVWQIDNNTLHSVCNNSADDRIVMIVDIHSD